MKKTNKDTPIRCNKCEAVFSTDQQMSRDGFCGTKAARVQDFSTCPHCDQTDHHWVYSSDIMPTFEGGFDKRKTQERKWIMEN